MATKKNRPTANPLVNAVLNKVIPPKDATNVTTPQAGTPLVADNPISDTKTGDEGKPKVFTDNETGVKSGVQLPDGRVLLGLSPDQVDEIVNKETKKRAIPEGAIGFGEYAQKKSALQEAKQAIGQIGVLTPEQQAIANANPNQDINMQEILSQVGTTTAKNVIGGAAGGAIAGAGIAGIPTAGAGAPLGAAFGALAGAVGGLATGITYGSFAAYQRANKEKTSVSETNVKRAIYNIRQSVTLANKGGDPEVVLEQFNNAYAELLLAQRQYKVQETSTYAWSTDVREKQVYLENYLQYTLPMQANNLALAVAKPNPAYVDYGLDTEGNPVEVEI